MVGGFGSCCRTVSPPTGLVTVVFLLLTVPVAAHLLGRAAYVSGADLSGVGERDELKGILDRQDQPLERRSISKGEEQ